MDYDILFLTSKKENSTKSCIINALVAEQQATNTQLHNILKKQYNKSVSYQAIRQALTELEEKKAIIKQKKNYSLNPFWVLELKDLVYVLEKNIIKKEQMKQIDKQTTQISLKNMYELGHFVLFSLEQQYFDWKKSNEFYVQLNHLWIPFADNMRRKRLIDMFKQSKTKVIIKGTTLGDKMLAKWYERYCKVQLGVKWDNFCEYMVQGDCVVQIYIEKELQKKIERIYSLSNIIRGNLFKQIDDMTYNEHNIQIIITRNKHVAEQIKQKINTYF
jgi:hypothetical protein